MENPINGSTVLKYPVPDAEVRKDVTYTDGGGRERESEREKGGGREKT